MIRVVYLTPIDPCDVGGGAERVRNTLQALEQNARVDVIVLPNDTHHISRHLRGCKWVRRPQTSLTSRIVGLMGALTSVRPSNIDLLRTWRLARRLEHELPTDSDLIWCFDLFAYFSLPRRMRSKSSVVIDLIDHVVDREKTMASRRTSRIHRLIRQILAALDGRAYERAYRKVSVRHKCFMSTQDDADRVQGGGVEVLVNTYNPPKSPLVASREPHPPTYLVIGSFNYAPNVEGVNWLLGDGWPEIYRRQPSARLIVAGPHSERFSNPALGVTGLGRVDDLGRLYGIVDVALVPILNGSGSRLKILEAWALQVPVVSTEAGAANLKVENGRNLLVANDSGAFAQAAITVSSDQSVRMRLVTAGHETWESFYSPACLEAIVQRTLHAGRVET